VQEPAGCPQVQLVPDMPVIVSPVPLDVAVIGDDSAAKAYVGAIPPAAVAAITGGRGAMPMKWWWLLLVLLAVIVIVWLLKRR